MISIAVSKISILFDLLVIGLFAKYYFHAKNEDDRIFLLSGAFFGLFLEAGTILQTGRYQYGKFAFMFFEVPISIGLAWGIIFYSCHTFVQKNVIGGIKRNKISKAIITGLLGLSVDLGMDAIAIRIGFWDWGNGLNYEYFGVPWGNFLAWFMILCSFSFFHQLVQKKNIKFQLIIPIFGSLAVVLFTNQTMLRLKEMNPVFLWVYIGVVFGVSLTIVGNSRVWLIEREYFDFEGLGLIMLHTFFFLSGFLFKIFEEVPFLLPIHMAIFGLYHWLFGNRKHAISTRKIAGNIVSKVGDF